ncbi:MAG: amidohydrolase family protein [Candidatus Cloacimonadaceae bacterium]|nr:amidohydrolase family protein [Candidatus Cloacimonadaceae bacterium]
MIIKPAISVISSDRVEHRIDLHLQLATRSGSDRELALEETVAYTPLINSHDHLIGNWVPRAGENRPYPNSHIWVEDMKDSVSYHERNLFWINDGSFKLQEPAAYKLALLGSYKNLFSGCGIVQDHAPVQGKEYYRGFPIKVDDNYRQCHSLTLGNWWGGEDAIKEMKLTQGRMPFIIHLGEGVDEITHGEFAKLMQLDLLKPNTLMIHGIAFSGEEIKKIACVGASICWCPTSNYYLIGKTMDIESAFRHNANVCIGTDSTMSGGVNLIAEFHKIREHFPSIKGNLLFKMVTENAVKALMLPREYACLNPKHTRNLLLVDANDNDPFENLLTIEATSIRYLMLDGIPIFGDADWLELLAVSDADYSFFKVGNRDKFVLGDPIKINNYIDAVLGYHKDFPYLPF